MKKTVVRVFVLIVTSVAALLVAPGQAQAAWSDCPPDWFCLFAGTAGTGGVLYTGASPQNLDWMDNNAESYWNRTGVAYVMYENSGHAGGITYALPGLDQRGTMTDFWKNRVSSVRRCGGPQITSC